MNLSHAEIKNYALAKLGNNKWGEAIGVTVVFFIITMVVSLVPLMGTIASALIGGPLSLGLAGYFLKVNRGEQVSLNNMFDGFKNFGNSFLVALLSGLMLLVIVLVTMIPIGLMLYFGYSDDLNNVVSSLKGGYDFDVFFKLMIPISLSIIILMIPAIMVTIGISQAYRILHDNPQISATDAMRRSWDMMKNRKMDYFLFNLGFIGWGFLCIFTLGLGTLVLTPYIQASNAKYYDELSGGNTREIDSIGEDVGRL